MIESTSTKMVLALCSKLSLRSLKENVGYKIKRCHTREVWAQKIPYQKGMCQIKRKRVNKGCKDTRLREKNGYQKYLLGR